MAKLFTPPLIQANATYPISCLLVGASYLLTLKGDFGGGTVKLQSYNTALREYYDVVDGSWTAAAEVRFVADSELMQLVVTGGSGSGLVGVTLTGIKV